MTIAIIVIVGFYLLVCTFAFTAQRHILFPAPKVGINPPDGAGQIILVEHGTPMLFQRPKAGHPVLVYFHGNGEQIADLAPIGMRVSQLGLGFAAIEYPGYGLAAQQGTPSESAIFDAAERGIEHLLEKEGIFKDQLIMAGNSLGTGVAMAMAEKGYGIRVLLLCPFTSVPTVAAGAFPFLPVRLLLKDQFDSYARAEKVTVPALVIHGTQDEVIPISHGRTLAARLPRGNFVSIEGAGHNGLWSHPEAMQHILAFIQVKRTKAETDSGAN